MAVMWFSRSIEEIHSPPDLITSLERSLMTMAPSSSILATSPVINQPLWNLSGASYMKYSPMIHGPRHRSSPGSPCGISLSRSSAFAMRNSTPGTGSPALTMLPKRASLLLPRSLNFATFLARQPRGLVSVIPQPCRKSTPSASPYQAISAEGGAEPPHVSVLSFSTERIFSTPLFSTEAFMPCQTVGTPVLSSTSQSIMHCRVDSGSMNLPVMTILQPNMSPVKGTPQLSTWNIGTNGSTTIAPVTPNWSAPAVAIVCK
mmetsp:Transcript_36257/g.93491  ORF Transcript_36257/g.93491 Transcript_36257/m.93491 type:complete len:260 (-) Transcript_36257:688-1467(-)